MPRITCLAAALAALIAGAGGATAQIRIATAGPLTGQYAAHGAEMRQGATLAVAAINAEGGVLGEPLVLEIADDACYRPQAVSVAANLVTRGVVFVAGHFCSSSSIAAAAIYGRHGVLQISPASTAPRFTEGGGWHVFRVAPRHDRQALVAAGHILSHLRDRRVAILHDGSAFGLGLAATLRRALGEAGLREALHAAYAAGGRDHAALIAQLREAGAEVVYFGGFHTDVGLILRQMRAAGLGAVAMGPDTLATDEFRQITGAAGEGTLITVPSDPRAHPDAAAAVARFRARSIEPGPDAIRTYAAVRLWAAAATRAGSADPRRVAAMLRTGGPWQSALGPVTLDAQGDVIETAHALHVWRGGAHGPP